MTEETKLDLSAVAGTDIALPPAAPERDEYDQRIAELDAYANAYANAKAPGDKLKVAAMLPALCDAMRAMLGSAKEEITRAEARLDGVLAANAAFATKIDELKRTATATKLRHEAAAREAQKIVDGLDARYRGLSASYTAILAALELFWSGWNDLPWWAFSRRARIVSGLFQNVSAALDARIVSGLFQNVSAPIEGVKR